MIVPSQPSIVWQPTLWLHTRFARNFVLQYEADWLDTTGYANVVLEFINYYGTAQTELAIEGCDTVDGGWTEVTSFDGVTQGSSYVMLSTSRARSDEEYRLWRFLRWRWQGNGGSGALEPYDYCFKIRAMFKP